MADANPLLPPPPPPPGLINTAPGLTNMIPGQSPTGAASGAPVTSYTPGQAVSGSVTSTGYTPEAFSVTPDQTVVSQIRGIIADDSPLMRQAEAKAKQEMNARGLLNSSMAINAGQDAVYKAAAPIATADAATYAQAARDTTTAQNAASQFGAGARNTALLRTAELAANTSQFNAGQVNAALSDAAKASNAVALQSQQIQGSKDIAELQASTSKAIAQLQSDTSLSIADKQTAMQRIVADIQANTSLSVADKQAATSMAVASLQADTTLTVEQQRVASQQAIAQLQATTDLQKQQMANDAALANIIAKGQVDTGLTQIVEANKTLLQNNASAANLYTQTLSNMANTLSNPNLDATAKANALNNYTQTLNAGLATFSAISNTPLVQTNLSFNQDGTGATLGPAATAADVTAAYRAVLGREPDPAGLEAYLRTGMTPDAIAASLRASEEYVTSGRSSVAAPPPPAPAPAPAPSTTPNIDLNGWGGIINTAVNAVNGG